MPFILVKSAIELAIGPVHVSTSPQDSNSKNNKHQSHNSTASQN